MIAEGGMGAVYEAEQDQPHRKVALKILKFGLTSPETRRRFVQESEALGRLTGDAVEASLASVEIEQGRYSESEPLLRQVLKGMSPARTGTWRRFYAEALLGGALAGAGRYSEAEPILIPAYRDLLARKNSIPAENAAIVEESRLRIVRMYIAWHKPDQASIWEVPPKV